MMKSKVNIFSILIVLNLIALYSCNINKRQEKELGSYLKGKTLTSATYHSMYKDSLVYIEEKTSLYNQVSSLKKASGIWKFYPKKILVFEYENGRNDTLYTNGFVFQYESNFFVSKKKIINFE